MESFFYQITCLPFKQLKHEVVFHLDTMHRFPSSLTLDLNDLVNVL